MSSRQSKLSIGKMHLIKPRLRKYPARFVRQKGRSNRLSGRASGHKHCRVDKVNCRVAKCISINPLMDYLSPGSKSTEYIYS